MNLIFKKIAGKWYCDLPNYPGNINDLEMVAGADVLCDFLPYKDHPDIKEVEVYYKLTEYDVFQTTGQSRNGFITLKLINTGYTEWNTEEGATYLVKGFTKEGKIDSIIWLCDVTKFVFEGEFPIEIIFKPITQWRPINQ